MAGGMDLGTPSRGGKKPLDAAINLVPFIDLMAVTISFLIMTAVWTQVGRLQASQVGGPSAPDDDPTGKRVELCLWIDEKELKLTADQAPVAAFSLVRDARGRMDLRPLLAQLKSLRDELPNQSAITLRTADRVRYEDLIQILDACVGAGLPSVSIGTADS